MCLQCDCQSQLNCGWQMFFNVPALYTGRYMMGTWLVFRYILNVPKNKPYIVGHVASLPCIQVSLVVFKGGCI